MDNFDINNFKKIAVYAYEEDGLLPKGIEYCEKTYRKLFDMVFPKIQITELFLDGPSFNQNNFRYEWYRLLHKCQHNEFDLVLIPSLQTLSQDGIQSMNLAKELIKHPNPPKVYFALEEIASTVEDFNYVLCVNSIINDAVAHRKRQKNKLLQYLKLTKSWSL